MTLNGTLIFARYAFMPNRLNYCGGDDNKALFDYCVAGRSDGGLVEILQKFQAVLPYLKLIARNNGIADPFDFRVVEAYWIGNALLDRVDLAAFYDSLRTRFSRQLDRKVLGYLLSKPPLGARPHHSFHVFDVHARTGSLAHEIETMDRCRIGWGRVMETSPGQLRVAYRPLQLEEGRLVLGREVPHTITNQINGDGFISNYAPGDWVSFHWDWLCDTLTERQVNNLERYTRYHLAVANRTL
jgi:hypothetical protein